MGKTKKDSTVTVKTENYSDLTELICIVDRSGSMSSIRSDAIGGFNTFLDAQKKAPGKANLTLVLFDDQYDVVHDAATIDGVEALTEKTYIPRGSTALLDAIGRAIIDAKTKVDNPREKPHVIVSILTDGEENASREFSRDQIFKMITEQTENGWEFIFLAANQDAISAGMGLGIGASNSFNFKSTKKGMQRTSQALNYAVSNVRSAYAGYAGYAGTIGEYADDMKDILEDESDATVDEIVGNNNDEVNDTK
jgi:hypothetical protein